VRSSSCRLFSSAFLSRWPWSYSGKNFLISSPIAGSSYSRSFWGHSLFRGENRAPGHVGILILFGKIDGSVTEGPSDSKVVIIGGKDDLPLIFNVGEELKSLKKD